MSAVPAYRFGDDGLVPLEDEATCRICGCTEYDPCLGGCMWVPDPKQIGELCSSCLKVIS